MIFNTSFQIGNRFALTAAHCLYDDDNEEVLPVTTFSIMLGLHDRSEAKEPNRWLILILFVHCIPGDRSGSARLFLMKTSRTRQMTLRFYN